MDNTIRIGLLDETSKDLFAIKKMISEVINYQIIFEAWNCAELINKMKQHSVDLLILNLQMTLLTSAR